MQTHIIEGLLVCPNCSKQYEIKKGVPNMASDKGKQEEGVKQAEDEEEDFEYISDSDDDL